MEGPIKPRGNTGAWKAMGLVSAIGIDLAICTLGGYFVGSWLDKVWSKSGIFTGIGVLIGVLVGICSIILIIKKMLGENNE